MDIIEFTRRKIDRILQLVKNSSEEDYPYPDAKGVYASLERKLSGHQRILESIDDGSDKQTVATVCATINRYAHDSYPLIGFLLRSRDVRNSFELHGPYLRLVKNALGEDASLVISSEWEFSPFTYNMPETIGVSKVAFIGMPASESYNALSIPLTGHELGHNIWRVLNKNTDYEYKIESAIYNHISNNWPEVRSLFSEASDPQEAWDNVGSPIRKSMHAWCMRQAQEFFCDHIGLYMFEESFLYAFAYFLAPGFGGVRSGYYPDDVDRANALISACDLRGIQAPEDYSEVFIRCPTHEDPKIQLILSVCDSIMKSLVLDIEKDAYVTAEKYSLIKFDKENTNKIVHSFELGVPATNPSSLSNVINAAWYLYNDKMSAWKNSYPDIYKDIRRREQMLFDLTFKSLEVMEINFIQGE